MSFSAEVKKLRLSCLLNQAEFADAIGVSFTTVNRWENGRAQPNIKAMKALRQFCEEQGCPYDPIEKSWHEAVIADGRP